MCPLSASRHKVVCFIPAILGGGIERVFLTLLRHISRKDFELHIASHLVDRPFLSAVPRRCGRAFLEGGEIAIHCAGAGPADLADSPADGSLRRLRHESSAHGGSTVSARGIRLIVRESTTPSAHFQHRAKHPQLESFLCRRLYRRADRVVCLSDSRADDLVEQFQLPRNKLVRIYNPVDLALLRELGETPLSPYAGPGPHIVAVARLSREKGLDILLDATALAP